MDQQLLLKYNDQTPVTMLDIAIGSSRSYETLSVISTMQVARQHKYVTTQNILHESIITIHLLI